MNEAWYVESYNSTSWGTLKKRLVESKALILCAQECGIVNDMVGEAGHWAMVRGWKALIVPAEPRPGGQTSMGVAVFVRAFLGLRWPVGGKASGRCHPHRQMHVVVDVPGWKELHVVNTYFVVGEGTMWS